MDKRSFSRSPDPAEGIDGPRSGARLDETPPEAPAPRGRVPRVVGGTPAGSLLGEAASALSTGSSSWFRADPQRLARTLPLAPPSGGQAYELVAASADGGVLEVASGQRVPNPHTRLVLESVEDALGPVQFVVRTLGGAPELEPGSFYVRWIAITATERRQYLVDVLNDVLGLRARVCVQDDRLGPHRKLVYAPERRQVELVNVGEQALPGARRAVPDLSRAKLAKCPGRRASTQPWIVVDDETLDAQTRELLETGRHRAVTPPPGPVVTVLAEPSRDELPASSGAAPEVGLPDAAEVHDRQRAQGCFAARGRMVTMVCGRVGHNHLSFECGEIAGLRVGQPLDVGVPASPVARGIVWVTGAIRSARRHVRSGQYRVEVDLRPWAAAVPWTYRSLVDYWKDQASDR